MPSEMVVGFAHVMCGRSVLYGDVWAQVTPAAPAPDVVTLEDGGIRLKAEAGLISGFQVTTR
jgi:hypothetical protein